MHGFFSAHLRNLGRRQPHDLDVHQRWLAAGHGARQGIIQLVRRGHVFAVPAKRHDGALYDRTRTRILA